MHVLLAGLYAVLLWLSLMAYLLIVGHPVGVPLALSPVLISGFTLALLVLDGIGRFAFWLLRRG